MAHEIKLTGTVLGINAGMSKLKQKPWSSLIVKSDSLVVKLPFWGDMAIAVYDNVCEGEVIEVTGTLTPPEIYEKEGKASAMIQIQAQYLKASGTLVKPVRVSKTQNPFGTKEDLIDDDPFN